MTAQAQPRFKTLRDLKNFIYSTVCKRENFAVGAFPMTEHLLKRGDKPCGFLFAIHGPRSVTCNAIFETENNTVHFYSASGERLMTVRVSVELLH